MENLYLEEKQAKRRFIERISDAVAEEHRISIRKIEYQVFKNKTEGWIQEYIIVTYDGGAIAARSCNGNSNSANFREIAKMIDGGYYEEVKDYRDIAEGEGWERII